MQKKRIDKAAAFLSVLMMILVSFSIVGTIGRSESTYEDIVIVEVNGPEDISILDEFDVDIIERYGIFALVDADGRTIGNLEQNGLTVNTLPKRTTIYVGGYEFDFTEGEPDIPDELRVESYGSGAKGQYIVHMLGPIAPDWRPQLEQMGVQIMNYVPNYAYRTWMTPELAEKVSDLYFVDWVGIYHPDYKLQSELGPGKVEVGLVGGASENSFELVTDIAEQVFSIVDARYRDDGYHMVIYVDSMSALYEIAKLNDVYYISRHVEPQLAAEIDSQIIGGGAWIMDDEHDDPSIPYRKHGDYGAYINQIGYSGKGVTIAIADTGLGDGTTPSAGHSDFEGRVIGGHSFYSSPHMWADGNAHGTHVAGSAAGDTHRGTGIRYAGHGPYYVDQGLAYESNLFAIKNFRDDGNTCFPDDYFEMIEVAAQKSDAYIHTNSWGGSLQGIYEEFAHIYDTATRNANRDTPENTPMVITVCAGNDDARGTWTPGTAKNVITVGATESYMPDSLSYGNVYYHQGKNPDNVASFSSRGWTADNRVKPDVVAPGEAILAARTPSHRYFGGAVEETGLHGLYSEDYRYEWASGTSMSTPAVAGAAAVTVEWYEVNHGSRPNPAMVKALLINTAHDLCDDTGNTGPIPNRDEGWGMVDISKLEYPYDDPVPFYLEDQTSILTTGEVDEYEIRYDRTDVPLKISLVWTDAPAGPGTGDGPTLVNDLDLEVEAPNGDIYRGNAFPVDAEGNSTSSYTSPNTPAMPDFDRNGDGWDNTNNVENVYIHPDGLEPGVYTVRVRGYGVNDDAVGVGYNSQDYALVAYNAHQDEGPYPPINPEPEDGATYVSLSPELSVEVSHPLDYDMTVSFYDAFTDSLIGTDYGVTSGSRASVEWTDLNVGTRYHWYAVADDGTWTTQSDTWEFTTVDIPGIYSHSIDTQSSGGHGLERTFLKVTSLRADSHVIYLDQNNSLFMTVQNTGGDAGDGPYTDNITAAIEDIEALLDEYSSSPRARQLEMAVEELGEALALVSEHQREESIKSVRKAVVHLHAAGQGRQGIPTEDIIVTLAERVEIKVGTVIREAKRNFGSEHPDVQDAEMIFEDAVDKLEDGKYIPALNKFRGAFGEVLNAYVCDANIDAYSWMPDGYESDIGSGSVESLEAESYGTIALNWHPTKRGVHQVRIDMNAEYDVYRSPAETVESPPMITSFGVSVTPMDEDPIRWDGGHTVKTGVTDEYSDVTIIMRDGNLTIEDGGALIFNDDVTFVIKNPDEPGEYGIEINAGGKFVINSPLRETTIMSSAQVPEYTYSFENYGTVDFTGANVMYTYGDGWDGGIQNFEGSTLILNNTNVLEADTHSVSITGDTDAHIRGGETVIGRLDNYNEDIAQGHGFFVVEGRTPEIQDVTIQYNQMDGIRLDRSVSERKPIPADELQEYTSRVYDRQLTDHGRTSTRPIVTAGNGAVYAVYLDEEINRIYFTKSYDEGVTWSEPIVVPGSEIESENGYIGNIDFAADADNLAVAWEVWREDYNDTIPDTYVQYSYTGGGDDNWADEPYKIGLSYNPSVDVEGNNIYLVYVYRPWPPWPIVGSVMIAWTGEGWTEPEGHVFDIEKGVPKVAAVGEKIHVVIASEGHIYYTRSDDGGEMWGTPIVIGEYVTEDEADLPLLHRFISLEATEERIYLAWSSYDAQNDYHEIYGKYAAREDDWLWHDDIHISSEATGDSVDPVVAVDQSDNWYVVWQEIEEDISRIRYSVLNINGEIVVSDMCLTPDTHQVELPSITIDSEGYAYLVWSDGRGDMIEIYIKQKKNIMSGMTVRNNYEYGFNLIDGSQENVIAYNTIHSNHRDGIHLGRGSLENVIYHNTIHSHIYGIVLGGSTANKVEKNIIEQNYIHENWVAIYSLKDSRDNTISTNTLTNNGIGIVMIGTENEKIISNLIINNDWHGIIIGDYLGDSDNNIISNNHIAENGGHGIYLFNSIGNYISGNTLENCDFNGIFLYFSDDNDVRGNTASNNRYGMRLWSSNENHITDNTLTDNTLGAQLDHSVDNQIYHNLFISNTIHAYDDGDNQWDNGYPLGGNYWDDHTGPDEYKGPEQDIPGSDGIVDVPRNIAGSWMKDRYPVVHPDRFNPTVDDINIVDSPFTGETKITDRPIALDTTVTGYAAGYNDTWGYIGDVSVTWSVTNYYGAEASTSPGDERTSTFFSGDNVGTAIWTAMYMDGIYDSVEFTIAEVDYIEMVSHTGDKIEDDLIIIDSTITGYAAGFNHTWGYVGDVSVAWSVANYVGAEAYTSPAEGESSTFNAGDSEGTAIWTADYGDGIYDSVEFTIAAVDSIVIVDDDGNEIEGGTISVGESITGYAAAYNENYGYLGLVSVSWSVSNLEGGSASISTDIGISCTFTAGLEPGYDDGYAVWNATYNGIYHNIGFHIVDDG